MGRADSQVENTVAVRPDIIILQYDDKPDVEKKPSQTVKIHMGILSPNLRVSICKYRDVEIPKPQIQCLACLLLMTINSKR